MGPGSLDSWVLLAWFMAGEGMCGAAVTRMGFMWAPETMGAWLTWWEAWFMRGDWAPVADPMGVSGAEDEEAEFMWWGEAKTTGLNETTVGSGGGGGGGAKVELAVAEGVEIVVGATGLRGLSKLVTLVTMEALGI